LRTAIWLPLAALAAAAARPASQRRWRWWIGGALAWATAFLAGHPQTFLHLSYAVVGWMGWLLVQGKRGRWQVASGNSQLASRPLQFAAGIFALCLLTFAFSAIQLLPSLEFTRLSVRASVDYAYVSHGFRVQDFWQMLFPGVLYYFSPLLIGIPGLLLAGLSLIPLRPAHCSPFTIHNSQFFLLLAILALLLSLGENGFLYPLFYRFAPGWNLFRGQERAAYLVVFGLSVLAGYGMAALPGLTLRARRLAGALSVGSVGAGALIFGLFWQMAGRGILPDMDFLVVALLSLLIALATAWLLWQKEWTIRRGWALAGLGIAVLFWANGEINVDAFSPARKTLLAPEVASVQTAQGDGRVYNEYRVHEDYGMSIAAEDVWGSSPLRLARYAALFDLFPLDRMWRLMGVDTVLTWRRELFIPSVRLAEFPQLTDSTYLHRLTEPNPRAWLVQKAQIADDATALALLADHGFDLETTAILPPDSPVDPFIPSSLHPIIQLTRPAPNRLHITLTDNPGGLLIVSENWLPGWHAQSQLATRNSQLPVLRANLTLLAAPLPPGDLAFDLVYWPASLTWGLAITGGTIFVVGIGVLLRRKRQDS
jgi:hypothetical protein